MALSDCSLDIVVAIVIVVDAVMIVVCLEAAR